MYGKAKLKILAVAVVVVILISVPLIYLMMNSTEEESSALVTVTGEELKVEDLEGMETVSGESKYQNRFGNWNEEGDYEGVPLNVLVDDMEEGDILKVTASDGYTQKFSFGQVNPTGKKEKIQGDIILAYQHNGEKVPDWEDGPRIAVLPEDGEFSNDDLNLTRSLVSDLDRQTSAGSLWVKNVEEIGLIENVYTDTNTALTLQGTTTHNYSMEEIKHMPSYTGEGRYIKSTGSIEGPYTYKGVNVTKLIYNVHNGDDYTLEVEATDGYVMTYTSDQAAGHFDVYDEQGNKKEEKGDVTMLLAYEEVGEDTLHGGPLRIVTVSEDAQITDGHFWAKMVRYIRVKSSEQEWTLELKGVETVSMDKQTFESGASCEQHKTTYQDGDDTYGGLPLWILVSAVDGGDAPDGHYMFNSDLAESGYTVKVTAGDGFYTTFTSQQIARNDSILVANSLNGEPLTGDDAPLRIVGEGLKGSMRVGNVVEIRLTDL